MTRLEICPLPEFDQTGGRVIVTSPFGPRWGKVHRGTDLGTLDGIEIGTPVYAPLDGEIVATLDDGPGPGAGRNIHLLCDNGARLKFFHLDRILVAKGQRVAAGDPIATVGMSGTQAPHLHLEEHLGSFSHPIDNTPDVQACISAGRFVGKTTPPVFEPVPPVPTPSIPSPSIPSPSIPSPLEDPDVLPYLIDIETTDEIYIANPVRQERRIITPDELEAFTQTDKNETPGMPVRLFPAGGAMHRVMNEQYHDPV